MCKNYIEHSYIENYIFYLFKQFPFIFKYVSQNMFSGFNVKRYLTLT